jgi:3,4-dihydroxy-2-butanone 4-phosphate synthase
MTGMNPRLDHRAYPGLVMSTDEAGRENEGDLIMAAELAYAQHRTVAT